MLGWVALDQSEVRSIAKKLAIPGSVGTVDELGLGVIIDSISQFLFPAFTTLMTRAKYFIFSRSVYEIAARSAWQRCRNSFREEERHLGNRAFVAAFKKHADWVFQDVDLAICLALSANRSSRQNDDLDHRVDYDGIAGSRNIARKLGKGALPKPPLFKILDRYPAALYFSGLRELNAFAQHVQDRDHLWDLYVSSFLGELESAIWDAEWAAATESTGTFISKLYSSFQAAREKGLSTGWEVVDSYELKFGLSKREASLLKERLCTVGTNTEQATAIVGTMLSASGIPADEEGYAVLAKLCEKMDAEAAGAFRAAADAMEAMKPALTLYQNLRDRLDPKKTKKEREAIAIDLVSRLDFKSARKGIDALAKGWSPNSGWNKAKSAIRWLSEWLDAGARANSRIGYLGVVLKLIIRENSTVRSRRKAPCLSQVPIGLTARGRKEREKKAAYDHDSDPPEAFVPRGRLSRALTIYSDIARGLKGGR